MAKLTDIQKKLYANQTRAMENEAALRAARVVAKARQELLGAIRKSNAATSAQQAVLSNLDGVLGRLEPALIKAIRAEQLVEKGYRQGKSLVYEVVKDTEFEGRVTGFTGLLDLRTYAQEVNTSVNLIKGISEDLKRDIKEQVEISLALGEGEKQTMDRIGNTTVPGSPFRVAKHRAERISRTVSNDLVNTGKMAAYKQYAEEFPELGIVNEWVNVSDFRTSDTCLSLVGQRRVPGQPFNGVGFSGTHPPAHPFAYLPDTLVITPSPELLLRFWYEGQTVTIVTQLGNKLTVTHEHPILTARGFVPAGLLNVGDHIFEVEGVQGGAGWALDNQEPVATIEDCFNLGLVSTPHGVMPATPVNLDSEIPDHKIDIEGTYRHLGNKRDALSGQKIKQLPFMFASGVRSTVLGSESTDSPPMTVRRGPFSVSPSLVSRDGNSFPFLGSSQTVEGLLSVGITPHLLATEIQYAFNNTLIPAQKTSHSISRDPGFIEVYNRLSKSGGLFPRLVLGQITEVTVSQYSGHVYHLQDSTALQCASGIIAHNCRSTLIPVITEQEQEDPTPSPPPEQALPSFPTPTGGEVTLDGQIAKGEDFVRSVVGKDVFNSLSAKSSRFKELAEKLFKGDSSVRGELISIRESVDPLIEEMINKLREQNRETQQEPRSRFEDEKTGQKEGVSWGGSDGSEAFAEIDNSVFSHPTSYSVGYEIKGAVDLLGGRSLEGAKLVYLDQDLKDTPNKNRGWAEHDTRTINIGGKRGEDLKATLLHETSHFIELDTPGANKASMELIKRRATGPLTALELVDSKYGPDEVFYPDEFISNYVGKVYPGENPGTEVLPIALQTLASPQLASELLLFDPEHFYYALGYIAPEKIAPPEPGPP